MLASDTMATRPLPAFVHGCIGRDLSVIRNARLRAVRSLERRQLQGHRVRQLCATALPRRDGRASEPSAVIVGGGPAGMFAAITLAEQMRTLGVTGRVIVLEATSKPLRKVLLSGGGRCNVTNASHSGDVRGFASNYPPGRGQQELMGPLSAWSASDTISWFEARGVALKVEPPAGKVFPVSNDAKSIAEALLTAARDAGVKLETGARVTAIGRDGTRDEGVFQVDVARRGRSPEHFLTDCVCVCTGSARHGYEWAGSLSHDLVPLVPSLFTFKVNKDARLDGLAGVAVQDVRARLEFPNSPTDGNGKPCPTRRKRPAPPGLEQRGPLLVTHWGLSGPAIIQLSSFAARILHDHAYHADCVVDFVPSVSWADKLDVLKSARARFAHKAVCNAHPFYETGLPLRMWKALVAYTQCPPDKRWQDVSNKQVHAIANAIHNASFHVSGKGEFKEEFVTAGGVALTGVSTKTFESKSIPGLYFAGEVLNIDGKTGGFNFQNCWSGGYLAGSAMAHRLAARVHESDDAIAQSREAG